MYVRKNYKILQKFREGGTSFLYEVKMPDQSIALLKIAKQPTTLINRQMDNEAQILASIEHDQIPTLYDKITYNKYYHGIIIEKKAGKPLTEIVEHEKKSFHWQEILIIAKQIAQIIQAFHVNHPPIILRDIKPSNVLLTKANKVSVIDFGASAIYEKDKQYPALGTIGYAAPEQFEHGPIDFRSDLFSFGAVLYYIASSGKNIYTNESWQEIKQILPKSFAHMIKRLTHSDPEKRYQTIKQVRKRLDKIKLSFFERIFWK